MDPNLLYWKNEGQSFLSRLRVWFNLLDPTCLLSSSAEIRKARSALEGGVGVEEKDGDEWTLSLSSIHSDSGDVLPLIFRPPAFLPFASPLVVGSFLPHATVKSALFWQFMMQSYCAGFNYANRNSSSEQGKKMSLNQVVMVAGSVSCSTCAGAVPQIIIRQLGISSAPLLTLLRSLLPVPLAAALASFSVYTVRYEELEKGIQVFDSNGNSVGISKAAGEKAIRETAVSRVALLGTSAALPNLLMLFLMRLKRKAWRRSCRMQLQMASSSTTGVCEER
ncbi:sideroflexin-4 isoform X2 [Lampris incognitus]|uniref:sideroflexin-4 isoform X2 n=1 Tax=Lampris incognitus TaxID=2546036 RepID=UPI0024B625EA|nr:sideroflexin-4 isoform X2 [Lampris incognitus]